MAAASVTLNTLFVVQLCLHTTPEEWEPTIKPGWNEYRMRKDSSLSSRATGFEDIRRGNMLCVNLDSSYS